MIFCGEQTPFTILVKIRAGTHKMAAIPTTEQIEAIASVFVCKTFDLTGNQTIVKRSIHIRTMNNAK